MKQAQIISDPKILGGKPVIEGTRISVELILDRISSGMSVNEILKDYPHLTTSQIQAALSYARNLVKNKNENGNSTIYLRLNARGVSITKEAFSLNDP